MRREKNKFKKYTKKTFMISSLRTSQQD
jgi:hypothetical protein